MLEVPFLDEIVMEKTRETARRTARETAQQYIVTFLEARFGDVPGDVVEGIESIDDETQLRGLVRLAASCPVLTPFPFFSDTCLSTALPCNERAAFTASSPDAAVQPCGSRREE